MHDSDGSNYDENNDQTPRVPDALGTALFYISLVVLLILGSILLFGVAFSLGVSTEGQVFTAVVFIFQAILTITLLYFTIKQKRYNSVVTLRLVPAPPVLYLIGIGGLISIGVLTGQFATILIDQFPDLLSENLIELISLSRLNDPISFVLFTLAISLGPGISEELAFRGFILKGLENTISLQGAIWLSAFVFALFHLDLLHIMLAFPAGLFLGYLVSYTGSILPAIVAHTVNNLWATLEANYWLSQESQPDPAEILLSTAYPVEMLLFFTALLILCLYGLRRYVESQQARTNSQ